ncbi:MAG: PAC2 family protein [Candidatus Marsarchaeota archaeon]|nr:PAC2 family protein [Candidatus Marsarchaeota archaeon]MCL5105985.1 PAC2 family protein [Candidatus Marsarchaeota archaeon]
MQIKFTKNIDFEGFTFLEGFPGIGLVGAMSISYVIEKLGLENVGYIESEDFPPLMSIHEGMPMHSIRVYASEKYRIITVFSEFSIPIGATYEIADALISFIKAQKIAKIISIAGIPIMKQDSEKETESKMYVVASRKEMAESAEKTGMKAVREGISSGINAVLMLKAVEEKIDDVNILVPINPAIINPKYAENAIQGLNRLLSLNINTEELEREAKEVESKIKSIIKKSRETHNQYKASTGEKESGNPMYV